MLKTPLAQLSGIGQGTIWKLKKLGLETIEDLIYHFPFRYDDFSQNTTVENAQIGQVVTLLGEVWSIKNIYTKSRKVLTQAIFNDGSSPILLTWFNQSYLAKQINVGDKLQISGKLSKYKNKLSIIVPQWEKINKQGQSPTISPKPIHTGKLVPIYPETLGLTSKWLRAKIDLYLPKVLENLKDPLPISVKSRMDSLQKALAQIHSPTDWASLDRAKERLGFDELFYVSLATARARREWDKKPIIKPLKILQADLKKIISKLPFELTHAQIKVIDEICKDLKKSQPMNRLIQGEVGSGKTVVAAIAAYLINRNKLKTLLMAPTEILAFQHFQTLSKLLKPYGIKIGIYTGSRKKVEKSDIIIGTHALLSPKLNILDIGLIIIDEQQRFGVEQRTFLRKTAKLPHFLTMTATPIPRTIALTLYGDLDLSIINELPKQRLKIKTYVVPSRKRQDAYGFIEKKVKEGDQVYIITPLIEESETMQSVKSAVAEFEKLKTTIFPKLKLGLLHGRLKSIEKQQIMQRFNNKEIDLLVSTSVVEVGVDVTNATIMVIESAERFGLSQLHQLRGRIGRGIKQSYCLLFSQKEGPEINRLKSLETINDGLKLAELDLRIRGSGEIFGIKQSGRFEFKIASIFDKALVEKTRKLALGILDLDPGLDKHPLLKAKLDDLAKVVMPD